MTTKKELEGIVKQEIDRHKSVMIFGLKDHIPEREEGGERRNADLLVC